MDELPLGLLDAQASHPQAGDGIAEVMVEAHRTARVVIRLAVAAFLLTILSLVLLAHFSGAPPDSTYVPAHLENGRLVPGIDK